MASNSQQQQRVSRGTLTWLDGVAKGLDDYLNPAYAVSSIGHIVLAAVLVGRLTPPQPPLTHYYIKHKFLSSLAAVTRVKVSSVCCRRKFSSMSAQCRPTPHGQRYAELGW